MNTPTPPPRLVPDRPSDAVSAAVAFMDRMPELQRLLELRQYDDTDGPMEVTVSTDLIDAVMYEVRDTIGRLRAENLPAIDAAAPPAEAPAERGEESAENEVMACAAFAIGQPIDRATARRILGVARRVAAAPAAPAEGWVNDADVLAALRQHVATFPSQKAFAAAMNRSESYVSDVLIGRRFIPDEWAQLVGFRHGWHSLTAPRVTGGREAGKAVEWLRYLQAEYLCDAQSIVEIDKICDALQAATGGEVGNG